MKTTTTKETIFTPGQIVVWTGFDPCILRIKRKCTEVEPVNKDCYESTSLSHNSLHYSHLRVATDEEIKMLGKKKKYKLEEK